MDESIVPKVLKDIWTPPVWKGGPKTDPKEYRPMASYSHIIKTMERVSRKQMVAYLELNDDMENSQHGSRNGRSTITKLIVQHLKIWRTFQKVSTRKLYI